MSRGIFPAGWLTLLIVAALPAATASLGLAAPITVSSGTSQLTLTSAGEFSLRFDKTRGGGITEYYDLRHDPGSSTNLAARGGSLYDGLFFVMFKQEEPEEWTASFRSTADLLEVVDATPDEVRVHVAGDFPAGNMGLPASYDFVYVVTSSAEIFLRARVVFNQAYANTMQIRMALALSAAYATAGGWTEYSEDGTLTPWYSYSGKDDDYLGAWLENANVRVDPVLIAYRDWNICDHVLVIAPPRADECLIAWVSSRSHQFTAGQVIERKYLLLMNQRGIDAPTDPAALAAAYRSGNGGDFEHPPDPGTVIVDNIDPAPRFATQGSWPTFNANRGFHGANYAINEVGAGNDWARWRPELTDAGRYRVFASWSVDADRPSDASFAIHHAAGVDTVAVDMRSTDASGWNLLGEYDFAAGTAGFVELTDAASNGAEVVADAIRFVFLGGPAQPDGSPGDGPSAGDGASPGDRPSPGDGPRTNRDAGPRPADDAMPGSDGGDPASPTTVGSCACAVEQGLDPWSALSLGLLCSLLLGLTRPGRKRRLGAPSPSSSGCRRWLAGPTNTGQRFATGTVCGAGAPAIQRVSSVRVSICSRSANVDTGAVGGGRVRAAQPRAEIRALSRDRGVLLEVGRRACPKS